MISVLWLIPTAFAFLTIIFWAGARYEDMKMQRNCWRERFLIQKAEDLKNITEDTSDGYHSFKDLYEQRAILFSTLCRLFPTKSWKSRLHEDGTMFDGHFIVGIETPEGQYTYHYSLDKWEWFPIKELKNAPTWDGHNEKDARRLWSLSEREKHV